MSMHEFNELLDGFLADMDADDTGEMLCDPVMENSAVELDFN